MKYFKTMWHNIRRSPYQALAAILIITQTFFVVTLFTFIIVGSSKIISYFESKPQVTAFFNDNAKLADIDALQKQLVSTGKIASIHFVSKQEALQRYKQYNKNDPLLLDLVTADILPASFEISTVNVSDLSGIASTLQNSPVVKNVVFQKDVVTTLTSWTNALRKIGTILIVVLGLDSIFIMLIIISIKVANKREDIEVMRLIGASKWYIRLPFLYEGVYYGIVGAIFGWLLAVVSLYWATPFLDSFLKGIPILPVNPLFLIIVLIFEVVLAVILGIFSSFLAVLRYMR